MVTKIVDHVLNLISPPINGAVFAADVNMGLNQIRNMADPTVNQDAATKFYVDQVATTAGGGVFLPAGFGPIPWSGVNGTVPIGWLLCDGASYPTASYPDLFAAIGYTYGGGGANFNVPDMRGTVPAGMDDMGAEYTLSLTGPAGNITAGAADSLGGFFGADTHTLTEGELARHDHSGSTDSDSHSHSGTTDSDGNHRHSGGGNAGCAQGSGDNNLMSCGRQNTGFAGSHDHSFDTDSDSHSHSLNINNAGSNNPHNNVQPTRFFGYIIKSTDATLAFPGDIVMGGNKITDLGAPTSSTDAATKGYVDSAVDAKASYDVALFVGGTVTTTNKEVARFPVVRSFTIASGFGNSQASCRVAPTAGSAVFEVKKQGYGTFGTVTFGIGSTTGVFAVGPNPIPTFVVGENLRVVAITADPGQADIGITIEAKL